IKRIPYAAHRPYALLVGHTCRSSTVLSARDRLKVMTFIERLSSEPIIAWPAGKTTSFDLDGCQAGDYACLVENGQNVSFTFGFQSESDESNPKVTIVFGHTDKQGSYVEDYDYTHYHTNACPTTACPIRKGVAQRLTFNTTIKATEFVSSGTAKRLTIRVHIEGNGNDLVCSEVYLAMIK
ncbi:unnamed protein product, partial [Medioppia subpectinata]